MKIIICLLIFVVGVYVGVKYNSQLSFMSTTTQDQTQKSRIDLSMGNA